MAAWITFTIMVSNRNDHPASAFTFSVLATILYMIMNLVHMIVHLKYMVPHTLLSYKLVLT